MLVINIIYFRYRKGRKTHFNHNSQGKNHHDYNKSIKPS